MIVLDANCALQMANNTEVGQILVGLIEKDENIVAPELFVYEVASGYSKAIRFMGANLNEIVEPCKLALALVSKYIPMQDIIFEAISESARLNHSVYDIFYLVLARRNGATLFTLDKKLQKLCLENGVNCIQEAEL